MTKVCNNFKPNAVGKYAEDELGASPQFLETIDPINTDMT